MICSKAGKASVSHMHIAMYSINAVTSVRALDELGLRQ